MEQANKDASLEAPVGDRVLVVDDLFVNRKLLCAYLEKIGCEVDIARDGNEAVSMAMTGSYGLIFMDIHMPYLGGIEATRQIRARMNIAPMIVGITADQSTSIRAKCREERIEVLVKPIQTQQLIAVLSRMRSQLDRRRAKE